ncbi:hypothetical protein WJX79_005196 [Trebouxia sp. C0005]
MPSDMAPQKSIQPSPRRSPRQSNAFSSNSTPASTDPPRSIETKTAFPGTSIKPASPRPANIPASRQTVSQLQPAAAAQQSATTSVHSAASLSAGNSSDDVSCGQYAKLRSLPGRTPQTSVVTVAKLSSASSTDFRRHQKAAQSHKKALAKLSLAGSTKQAELVKHEASSEPPQSAADVTAAMNASTARDGSSPNLAAPATADTSMTVSATLAATPQSCVHPPAQSEAILVPELSKASNDKRKQGQLPATIVIKSEHEQIPDRSVEQLAGDPLHLHLGAPKVMVVFGRPIAAATPSTSCSLPHAVRSELALPTELHPRTMKDYSDPEAMEHHSQTPDKKHATGITLPSHNVGPVPDLTSRHGLPEGIILVGHNNLIKGLAIDEELATAVNGTMSDLVSMEQTRYPWLTGQRTGVSAGPNAHFQDRQSLEPHPISQPNDSPSFHTQHNSQPHGCQGFATQSKSLLHGRPNYGARVGPRLSSQQSTGVRPTSHPVAVPRLGVVSSSHGISWFAHQAAGGAGSEQPSTDTLQAFPQAPRQRSLPPPGPFLDARLRAVTPEGAAPSPQLLVDPVLVFKKGPRIKTTVRTNAAGPTAKPVVHVIGSRRAVPLPNSPGADSPSPRAYLLYPEAASQLTQALKQQQTSMPPQPARLEARKELVSSGPAQTVHEGGGLLQTVTTDDGIVCQRADQRGPDPGPSLLSGSTLTEAVPEAAGECDEEWVPDNEAMLAASALAGMADSHLEEGRDKAEDVTLVDIKHRLQSLIAQLDTHPALAMEQHRMEPESSDMDIHADDSAQRSKVADTHDVDKLYLAGNMPAAAYKSSSSWVVSSSPHQLHAGVQMGSPTDTPIGPKPPSNAANQGLPTHPPRWISVPMHHPVNFKSIAQDYFDSLAAKLEKIELETMIQQLQHELKAVRQQQASQISTLEVQLEAAQLCAARAEAAHEHAVQQQFADDCLKESEGYHL